jgi:hypothetical protein
VRAGRFLPIRVAYNDTLDAASWPVAPSDPRDRLTRLKTISRSRTTTTITTPRMPSTSSTINSKTPYSSTYMVMTMARQPTSLRRPCLYSHPSIGSIMCPTARPALTILRRSQDEILILKRHRMAPVLRPLLFDSRMRKWRDVLLRPLCPIPRRGCVVRLCEFFRSDIVVISS